MTITTTTYNATGSNQNFVVPADIYQLQVQIYGAGAYASTGGRVLWEGVIPVSPGDVITLRVGQTSGNTPNAGWPDGGQGGRPASFSGVGGAGSTTVLRNGVKMVQVGGRGGDGFITSGGVAGIPSPANAGGTAVAGQGGGGGTSTTGGQGGSSINAAVAAQDGAPDQGGKGALTASVVTQGGGGGGGGGGYRGGGGGGVNAIIGSSVVSGAGGGGSSYVASGHDIQTIQWVQGATHSVPGSTGHGQIVVTMDTENPYPTPTGRRGGWFLGLVTALGGGAVNPEWSFINSGVAFTLFNVEYVASNTWVVGGIQSGQTRMIRSTDHGQTWSAPFAMGGFYELLATNGTGTVIAAADNVDNRYRRSTDGGATWSGIINGPFTAGAIGTASPFRTLAYGNGRFVASASEVTSGSYVSTSVDGLTWTTPVMVFNPNFSLDTSVEVLRYGNGRWNAWSAHGEYSQSATGVSAWSAQVGISPSFGLLVNDPAWSGSVWVAGDRASGGGTDFGKWRSADGITWTGVSGTGTAVGGIQHFAAGIFIGNGSFGSTKIHRSTDGLTWVDEPSPWDTDGNSPTDFNFGGGRFVAVGSGGKIAIRPV